ncbi:MAG: methyl-coenzyme M reductase I operon protein C [Candidatus Lokiarchaeota archaeon]|nr:methyl-coenzyme M reductase I operon protein C [Candidatus Lokiarchaeota archaeon]
MDKKKSCKFKGIKDIEDPEPQIGRKSHVIDCRATPGIGFGGGFAQRGTLSKSEEAEVLVLSMGPTKRHITKPVCEITYGLREADIEVSVLVMEAGTGIPVTLSNTNIGGFGSVSGITKHEIEVMKRFKLLIIHLGNVPGHFVYKAKLFLKEVNLPAVIICQAPVKYVDFEKVGVRTINKPDNEGTTGIIVDIITGIIRGKTVPAIKIEEIVSKVKKQLRGV